MRERAGGTAQRARLLLAVRFGALSLGVLSFLLVSGRAAAQTAQETCDKLAGEPAVKLENIDAASAVSACAAAVAAGQTPRLEYEYGRALERAGRRDEAKQMYQWAAEDNYAAAASALARLNGAPTAPASSATVASSSSAPPEDAKERAELAAQFDALGVVTANIAKSLPRDHDDPLAILAKTGTDASAILAWVRTNTRLIPYAGMLRGASGVLMDRAGNSLDRSLLLADLLSRAGHQVRLARATLAPPVAAALAGQPAAPVPSEASRGAPNRDALLKTAGNDSRLDSAMVAQAIDDTIASNRQFSATVKSLYDRVGPAVQQALGSDPRRDQQLLAAATAASADHFWVQRRVATGWEGLDVDGEIVKAPVAAATFASAAVPDDLKHKVTIKLVLETWNAGKLGEATLLERSWLPSELADNSVTLTHSLLPAIPTEQLVQQAQPQAAYTDDIGKAWVIEPVLRVGSESITDKLYTVTGQVLPAGGASLASLGVAGFANFAKLGAGITAAFGDKQASDPSDERESPIKVVAEWLEIDVAAPGRTPERHRRAVFDFIGPAARAKGGVVKEPTIDPAAKQQRAIALSGTVDAYVFGATPSSDWVERIAAEGLSTALGQAADTTRTARGVDDVASKTAAVRLQLPLWSWAAARATSGVLPQNAPVAANVALLWQSLALHAGEAPTVRIAFDIVTNETVSDSNFSHRVAQGVMDTIMEHAIFGATTPNGNAAALHALDIASGRNWTRLNSTADVAALSISADAKARVTAELANGRIIIAPSATAQTSAGGSFAWWQIDPNTGATIGMGENGLGTTETEESLLVQKVSAQGWCFGIMLANVLVGHVTPVSMGLFMLCVAGASITPFLPHSMHFGLGVLEWTLRAFELLSAGSSIGAHGGGSPSGHH
jgi:hypothetical protein